VTQKKIEKNFIVIKFCRKVMNAQTRTALIARVKNTSGNQKPNRFRRGIIENEYEQTLEEIAKLEKIKIKREKRRLISQCRLRRGCGFAEPGHLERGYYSSKAGEMVERD
jgi:hypothetical protein